MENGNLELILYVVISLCCCLSLIGAIGGGIFFFMRSRKAKADSGPQAVQQPSAPRKPSRPVMDEPAMDAPMASTPFESASPAATMGEPAYTAPPAPAMSEPTFTEPPAPAMSEPEVSAPAPERPPMDPDATIVEPRKALKEPSAPKGGVANEALSGMGMPQVPYVPDSVRTAIEGMVADTPHKLIVEQQRLLIEVNMPAEALADGTEKVHTYQLQLSFDPNSTSVWLTDFDNGSPKAERILRNYMTPSDGSFSFDSEELKSAVRPLLAEAGWPANN